MPLSLPRASTQDHPKDEGKVDMSIPQAILENESMEESLDPTPSLEEIQKSINDNGVNSGESGAIVNGLGDQVAGTPTYNKRKTSELEEIGMEAKKPHHDEPRPTEPSSNSAFSARRSTLLAARSLNPATSSAGAAAAARAVSGGGVGTWDSCGVREVKVRKMQEVHTPDIKASSRVFDAVVGFKGLRVKGYKQHNQNNQHPESSAPLSTPKRTPLASSPALASASPTYMQKS
jgi:hypothetical protein